MGGHRKIVSKKREADIEYIPTRAEQRSKVGGKCTICPPHDGENRGRRPRSDKHKRRGAP